MIDYYISSDGTVEYSLNILSLLYYIWEQVIATKKIKNNAINIDSISYSISSVFYKLKSSLNFSFYFVFISFNYYDKLLWLF